MKTVEFVVILSLCIHFAYSSSINPVFNEAAAEDTADANGKLLVLSADEATAFETAAEDPAVDKLMVPLGGESLDDVGRVQSGAARSCTANVCRELCRRLGFRYWACSGSWCICSN